jgi:hypothetical protein
MGVTPIGFVMAKLVVVNYCNPSHGVNYNGTSYNDVYFNYIITIPKRKTI